jgi:MYXO-CTERM domain-containing protein
VSRRALLSLLPFLAACGGDVEPPPPFRFFDEIRVWARSASAVAVYSNAYELLAASDGQEVFLDATCPDVDDDDETLSVSGSCTDNTGKEWKGSATVERDGDDRTVTFDDFNGVEGEFSRQLVDVDEYEFQAELEVGGVTNIVYVGSVSGGYDGASTWNGSGHVERHGEFAPYGAVDAVTENEVIDDAECSGQPISGSTTLTADGDTAVITYDGGVDCDDQQNAQLTVNDVDQGLIDGIHCSVSAVGDPRARGVWLGIVALSLLARRARRHRC